ncbi:phosphate ABC transporter substrate-binding protein [Halomonas sp. McH1-25]|uniref:PstS family phosphate ABC transporter substrate-binding protein n=1 Tax=unclassified Halomonas TaxID=2609666 RepID=UPI001EF44B0E|nr:MULTISPECIES: phosphate ABC transporter substrate-binding protein [unclassified Halomonas]MCG7599667.1 phosphate ABC transporter substrate-binding protein [Halomonas sp. McH1-25]MCP1344776.1 phosphate ABC transporter substrate-binding protein [Halomonas sp. FL8]MCP1363208.1 phosphate ABC transporter substrate-binding protein [Halomonas sp. BBD45]
MTERRRVPNLWWLLIWLAVSLPALGQAERQDIIAGNLDITGSDTLAELMMAWGERFERRHPGVSVQLQATGSATAPPALVQGTSRIGAMSRRMTPSEREAFIERYGYAPLSVPVAIDALAVFVHRTNPLQAISLTQLDALFSDTYRCGGGPSLAHWGGLGLSGRWKERPIELHGRTSASGTYAIFKRDVLCHGDFRPRVNKYTGSSAVVAAVAESPAGIGYAGMGYLTQAVKPLALIDARGERIAPTMSSAISGRYPLARPLYLYVNLPPGTQLPPLERAFFDLVLSPGGQALVRESGFVPLPEATLAQARRTLGLEVPVERMSSD